MDLAKFSNKDFKRGRSLLVEAAWMCVSALLVNTWLPGSGWRVCLLRLFGAKIASAVIIKPGVKIKFPWRLTIGENSWIGEDTWIDNLASVQIGANVCISQGVYLCTGSHNWKKVEFDLITSEIVIGNQSWICAKVSVAPGTVISEGVVISMGTMISGTTTPWTIYYPTSHSTKRRSSGND